MRIDTHHHLLPGIDDGCRDLTDTLTNLQHMALAGYSKIFCTPHCFNGMCERLNNELISSSVRQLQITLRERGIPIEILPGGELCMVQDMVEQAKFRGIPTFGMANQYVLVESWSPTWEPWLFTHIEWLQKRGLTVILAHPERMRPMHERPALLDELTSRGVLLQGTLGPIAGKDSALAATLSERLLKEGRYFMVATDGHRSDTLPARLTGLDVIRKFVGEAALTELTITNPAKLWSLPSAKEKN